MTLKELHEELGKILKVHPEAEIAQVWHEKTRINAVGLDKRHRPPRIKLYD